MTACCIYIAINWIKYFFFIFSHGIEMQTFLKFYLHSSTLLARIGSNHIAESMMTFNTNYKDVGLFGVMP